MDDIVYVVTFDGYNMPYGAEIYLKGVFATKTMAEAACKEVDGKITELEINKSVPVDKELGEMSTEYYLGGYCE